MNVKNGLELCQDHKQECNQSHFDKHNCDYCKLQKEVERLRAELADTENARDSWRRFYEKQTEAKHQAWAALAAVRAELEEIVGETIKRNGWGAE